MMASPRAAKSEEAAARRVADGVEGSTSMVKASSSWTLASFSAACALPSTSFVVVVMAVSGDASVGGCYFIEGAFRWPGEAMKF